MPGNGRVFISHAHSDNDRCAPILAALHAWGVDFWFDAQNMDAGQDLSASIQRAIEERDIFIRIGTPAAQASYWVRLETGAFRGLQAQEHREGTPDRRTLINIIMDPAYKREPFDFATLFIDATSRPPGEWLDELRRALGAARPRERDASAPGDVASVAVPPPSPDTSAYGTYAAERQPLPPGDETITFPTTPELPWWQSLATILASSSGDPGNPGDRDGLPKRGQMRFVAAGAMLLLLVSFAGVAVASGGAGLLALGRPGSVASPTLLARAKATSTATRAPATTATPSSVPTDTPVPVPQFPPTPTAGPPLPTPTPTTDPNSWLRYTSPQSHFAVDYRGSWSPFSPSNDTVNGQWVDQIWEGTSALSRIVVMLEYGQFASYTNDQIANDPNQFAQGIGSYTSVSATSAIVIAGQTCSRHDYTWVGSGSTVVRSALIGCHNATHTYSIELAGPNSVFDQQYADNFTHMLASWQWL